MTPAQSSPTSNKENASPASSSLSRPKLTPKRPVAKTSKAAAKEAPFTPEPTKTTKSGNAITVLASPSASITASSGLKLKLRGLQAALHEYDESRSQTPSITSSHASVVRRKRAANEIDHEDGTDSDTELSRVDQEMSNAAEIMMQLLAGITFTKAPAQNKPVALAKTSIKIKKQKIHHRVVADEDDDAMFEAGHDEDSDDDAGPQLSLFTPLMKRNARILDPAKPEHATLIANAPKAGSEYYDSDADDVAGDVKDTSKPHLFRNVVWGSHATDMTSSDFPTEPEFTQFVPGRFELLPDGTVSDQKAKLIVKLTDKNGRKHIFTNPPPRDWHNQEAITALNKRTVQQIRRNTNVRFREVVQAYVAEERKFILANLTAGKPTNGWKAFVDAFNAQFEGEVLQGVSGSRPYRSHSSLTKEVERFGAKYYAKGLVPMVAAKKSKVKKE